MENVCSNCPSPRGLFWYGDNQKCSPSTQALSIATSWIDQGVWPHIAGATQISNRWGRYRLVSIIVCRHQGRSAIVSDMLSNAPARSVSKAIDSKSALIEDGLAVSWQIICHARNEACQNRAIWTDKLEVILHEFKKSYCEDDQLLAFPSAIGLCF